MVFGQSIIYYAKWPMEKKDLGKEIKKGEKGKK